MPASYVSGWSHPYLNAFLRSAASSSGVGQLSAVSGLRYRNTTATDFATAANGEAALLGAPLAMTHANVGTVTTGGASGSWYTGGVSNGLVIGTSGSGAVELETSNLSSGVSISSSGTPVASNVTRFKVGVWKKRGTVEISTTLRNALVDLFTGKRTTHFCANGFIRVYSGAAPSPDSAATGTLMWQKTVDTTSAFTWGSPVSDASALTGNLVATSEAFGANLVVGYARFVWTFSAVDYVIQGTVGQGTGDFQFVSLTGAGTNEMAQSTSYTMNNATMAF